MKFKGLITLCMAGFAVAASAQTHVEGEEYYKADQLGNAKELLVRSLQNNQTDKAVSNYYLGMIALKDGNKAEAEKYFTQGTQANAEYAYNYVGLGELSLLNGDLKAAEQSFKDAEKLGKKDASLSVAIARAYYAADPVKYEKQITKYVEKARKTNMQNPDIYLFEGDQRKAEKDFGGAAAQYEMAANYNPDASEAYVKYADLFTMVNPQYAIDMLNKLLEKNPTSALGQRELALAYYNNKDYANAAKEYAKYVNNPSHFKNDEDRYAFLLFYSGDFKKGYDYASKLLAADPDNFTARRYQFMNAAQLPELKGETLGMAEALYNAHKANPDKNKFAVIDYRLISQEYANDKRNDERIAVLEEAVKDLSDNAQLQKDLAMAYVDANKISNAADAFKAYMAKSEEPGYNDFVQQATFDFYAGVENQESDPDKAAKYFNEANEYADKAAAILPDNYKPVMLHGDVAKQTATKEQAGAAAKDLYEKALSMLEASSDPLKYTRDAKTLYNYLGNYYLDQNNVAKAKEYFNRYKTFDPNNEEYAKFVEGLK